MRNFHPKLAEAENAVARMEALCEFIEFWLGPREDRFGASQAELDACPLPVPLRRLHQFAGHWPGFDERDESPHVVGAFSCQDNLIAISEVKLGSDGKVSFLSENQDCWICRTLVEGDDPPVWCDGDYEDEQGESCHGERIVCDSLSRFLVTFILQEMTLSSRVSLFDNGLSKAFEADQATAIPVWLQGPYVHGAESAFFLWNDCLVASLWGDYSFGANHPTGVDFLTSHQGPVIAMRLSAGIPCQLEIRDDGSAQVSYQRRQIYGGDRCHWLIRFHTSEKRTGCGKRSRWKYRSHSSPLLSSPRPELHRGTGL